MANRFSIDPLGGYGPGVLQGLGEGIDKFTQKRDDQAAEVKQQALFQQMSDVYATGDLDAQIEFMIKNPGAAEVYQSVSGYKDAKTKANAMSSSKELLSSPESAYDDILMRRADWLDANGVPSAGTRALIGAPPEKVRQFVQEQMIFNGLVEQVKAYRELQGLTGKKRNTTTVDGIVVDTDTGKVVFEAPKTTPDMTPLEKAKIKKIAVEIKKIEKETNNPKAKTLTQDQAKSSGFLARMENSQKEIDRLLTDNPEFDPSAVGERVAAGLPFVGNIAASPEYQQYRQAADDWIRAKLRRESGAVIGADEMRKEYEIYFPQVGDSEAVIEQKGRARKVAQDAMRIGAGTVGKKSNLSDEDLLNKYGG